MLGCREERVCSGGVGKAGGIGWGSAFAGGQMGQQVWLENLLGGKRVCAGKQGKKDRGAALLVRLLELLLLCKEST